MDTQVRTSPLEFECAMDEAADMLDILTEENDEVMLWGAPGIGLRTRNKSRCRTAN